jgi:hypothetical protein
MACAGTPSALSVTEGKRTLLTYRRLSRSPLLRALLRPPMPASLLHAPRPVVVKRLALSVLCCGTLAAAGFIPVAGSKSAPPTSTASVDRSERAASRGEQRTSPSGTPGSGAQGSGAQGSGAQGSGAQGSGAQGSGAQGSASAAPAPSAKSSPAAPAAPAQPAVPSVPGLDQYQAENAQTIVNVGSQMGVSTRGKVIAVATAMQESKLYNLGVAVDYDSLGLFQQRPSTGWGTPAEITTPSYAARAFYSRLLDTQGDWGCLTCAAQRVQGSAFPDAYAQWEGLADSVVSALGG